MKLSRIAKMAIKGSRDLKEKLLSRADITRVTLWKWVATDDDNLTKAWVIKLIHDETGLPDEQILESETVEQK